MSGFQVDRRRALALGLGSAAVLAVPAWSMADQAGDDAIDAIVTRFMTAFETPGVAVAIIRPDAPPFLKGYGVRTAGRPEAVDAHTAFGIASNSKSFTAAALAQLVDAGRIAWDDRVTRHLPEFRMIDPDVTRMMTVRDLLIHSSGLALGAGDLMQFPASERPASEALKGLPFLQLERGFRVGYAYDNILYVIAGLLVERVTGKPWSEVIASELLAPLGMTDAVPALRFLKSRNVAGRHARLGPPVRGMGPMRVIGPDEGPMTDAAGGINASVSDIAKWLQVQLAQGVLPGGGRLWSAQQAAEMWTPRTIITSSDGPSSTSPARAVTQTYALGWFIQDYRGERLISHSGGLSGQVTQTAMLPARKIGVAVFSNVEEGVSAGIRNALLDHLTGAPPFDWVASMQARMKKIDAETIAALGEDGDKAPPGGPSLPLKAFVGRYRDPWYGDVVVSEKGGKLWIDFTPTPVFKSVLDPWGPDTFRTRFAKEAGEDAVVTFEVKDGRVARVTMKPLSPLADFSYDYQHLDFAPVR